MTDLIDLRTLARPLRPRAAYRKHSSSKPGVLPDEPIASYRDLVALQIAESIRSDDTLSDIHARFASRFRCPTCLALNVCAHRSRAVDIKLIMSFKPCQNK